MALSGDMASAIEQPFVRSFFAVQVVFPDYTINLVDGSGTLQFPVNGVQTIFNGSDPVFGTISTIAAIPEAWATQAPSTTITFMPPSVEGIANLNNPAYQGSPVAIWFGIVDNTGVPVASPELLFTGQFDYSQSTADVAQRVIQMNVISVFEMMFVAEEAARLNDQYHQSIWPGENGLSWNIQALAEPFWGQAAPTNPTYPTLPIAPTLSDRLSGQNQGGSTNGMTWGPST